jgi:hypothetical protein
MPYNSEGNALVKAFVGMINPALFKAGTILSCPLTLLSDAPMYRLRIALCESPNILGIII